MTIEIVDLSIKNGDFLQVCRLPDGNLNHSLFLKSRAILFLGGLWDHVKQPLKVRDVDTLNPVWGV